NKVIEKNNSVYVSFTGNASPIDNGEICETFACVYIPQKNKTIEYHKNYVNVSRTRIILDACDSVAKIIIKETLKS
ncbi:MAG: hypothetical protein LBM99_02445, partial [Bacillales bacterium]|nr:hypothetical protein [Bacillales bacterium]